MSREGQTSFRIFLYTSKISRICRGKVQRFKIDKESISEIIYDVVITDLFIRAVISTSSMISLIDSLSTLNLWTFPLQMRDILLVYRNVRKEVWPSQLILFYLPLLSLIVRFLNRHGIYFEYLFPIMNINFVHINPEINFDVVDDYNRAF